MRNNAVHVRELHLKEVGSNRSDRFKNFCMNVLLPILPEFENLELLYLNIPPPRVFGKIDKNFAAMINKYLQSHPKIKCFPVWNDLPEFSSLNIILSELGDNERLPMKLKTAEQRGMIHFLSIKKLSLYPDDLQRMIIDFVKENSQNILIQRLFCDFDDFHEHFHQLNAVNVTLTHSGDSDSLRSPFPLSHDTQILICFEFIPVFAQTFPNLKTVYLDFRGSEFNLSQYKTFANSYQQLDLLHIVANIHSGIQNLEHELDEIYATSPKTFYRIVQKFYLKSLK